MRRKDAIYIYNYLMKIVVRKNHVPETIWNQTEIGSAQLSFRMNRSFFFAKSSKMFKIINIEIKKKWQALWFCCKNAPHTYSHSSKSIWQVKNPSKNPIHSIKLECLTHDFNNNLIKIYSTEWQSDIYIYRIALGVNWKIMQIQDYKMYTIYTMSSVNI